MTTRERQRTTVKVRVMVLDGDDQYPQFLPCNFMSHDGLSVCVSPTYLVNITTEKEPVSIFFVRQYYEKIVQWI